MSVLNVVMTIVVIILIIIIIRMLWRKNALVSVTPANIQQIIESSSLGNETTTTNNCTYSIWIYINDWSVNYGEEKVIFQRSLTPTDSPDFRVSLSGYDSSLIVKTNVLGYEQTYSKVTNANGDNQYVCNQGDKPTSTYTCLVNTTPVDQMPLCISKCTQNPLCIGYQTIYSKRAGVEYNNCYQVNLKTAGTPANYIQGGFATGDTGYFSQKTVVSNKQCIVPNIEIQKWINITLSADTNNMDIYINGNLVQSCDLDGEINIRNTTNLYISPNGKGFNGWNSRFRYLPKYINPHQAMDIYRRGHGSSNIGSLDYNVKVTLINGNQETASVNI